MSTPKAPKSLVRCEICNRVLDDRPGPRLHRCAEHKAQGALFPLSAVGKRRRRSGGGR